MRDCAFGFLVSGACLFAHTPSRASLVSGTAEEPNSEAAPNIDAVYKLLLMMFSFPMSCAAELVFSFAVVLVLMAMTSLCVPRPLSVATCFSHFTS